MLKRISMLLIIAIGTVAVHAAVIQLDNRSGSAAAYLNFVDAHTNATSGDTIYVYPSSVSYGNAQISKRLFIVGPGRSAEMSNGITAAFNTITLVNGASQSEFHGIQFARLEVSNNQVVNSVRIANCLIEGNFGIKAPFTSVSVADNWMIEDNLFKEVGNCGGCNMIDMESSAVSTQNWIIRNNIFEQLASNTNRQIYGASASTIVMNNLFVQSSSAGVFESSTGVVFQDNIIWSNATGLNDVLDDCTSCSVSNNLTWSPNTSLNNLPGTANLNNTDPLFSSLVNATAVWDLGNDYELSSASPAFTASSDGTQIGLYGSGHEFRNEGYPQMFPRVHQITPQAVNVTLGTNVTVQFKAFKAGK